MQQNNQERDYSGHGFYSVSNDPCENQQSFAEVVNHEDDEDQIGNIFNQGNLLLRNEESGFIPEDVGSLDDQHFQSPSNSDEESNNGDNCQQAQIQVPNQQPELQQHRYNELAMQLPDTQPRHTTFMPVFTQEDELEEVEIVEQQIGNERHLSGRNSGVSESDFYSSSHFSQPNRLFQHEISINHFAYQHLGQPSQQEIYQQQQSPYLHRSQFGHDPFYLQAQERIPDKVNSSSKDQIQQLHKPDCSQEAGIVDNSCDSLKERVFVQVKFPSEDSVCMEVNKRFDEPNLSENKRVNSSCQQSLLVSDQKLNESESCRVHSAEINEQSVELKANPDLSNEMAVDHHSSIKAQNKRYQDSKSAFKIVKGKRRTVRERKFLEKRRRLIEQAFATVKEIGANDWESLARKLEADKPNPFSQYNTSTFWYQISSLFFCKSYQNNLAERLCNIVSQVRGIENKSNEKTFKDQPKFIRKSYRIYAKTLQLIDRKCFKFKDSQTIKTKSKEQKKFKDRNPTEIEDLLHQLLEDKEDCSIEMDFMVSKLLSSIKQQKRPRFDNQNEDSSLIRQHIQKNSSCQQVIAFNKELNNFSCQTLIEYLEMEEKRYSKIKEQKLKQLRDQYERARVDGSKDYIACELVGKSFLGMVKNAYDSCFICGVDEYDTDNSRLQCSVCEYFVHSQCLGDNATNTAGEGEENFEANWTCQSCQVDLSIRQRYPGIDVSFKPSCVFCGLTGGIMRSTTYVCSDIKKTPGCNNSSSWSASSTNGMSLSSLTRKEKEYQMKLVDARIKLWQNDHEGQNIPFMSNLDFQEEFSLVSLPELPTYAASFVHWAHMSCASWLQQKNLLKKKPILLKQLPDSIVSGDKCEICGGSNGIFQTCTFTKKKAGEDQILEELYKECMQASHLDPARDSIMTELLDEQIEGGLGDSVTHANSSAKNLKGQSIQICKTKMHVECARRAEYIMKFNPETEQIDFFCSEHTPLPLKTDLKKSLDDEITNITDFVEYYINNIKDSVQTSEWQAAELKELFKRIASTFFSLTQLSIPVEKTSQGCQILKQDENEVGLLPGNRDWKVTLDSKEFPWDSIAVGCHDSVDCWRKYWDIVGLSEVKFRQNVMGDKNNQQKYMKFVKLRQLKIQADQKQVRTKPKELTQPNQVKITEEQSVELEKSVIELQTLEILQDQSDICSQEQVAEQPIQVIELTPNDQQKEVELFQILEKIEDESDFKEIEVQQPIPDDERISGQQHLKRSEKKKGKMQNDKEAKSCYCKCSMTTILEQKSAQKKQSTVKEPLAKQAQSLQILQCASKRKCLLGAYFHVDCCLKADSNFEIKKKWICIECNTHKSNVIESDENKKIQRTLRIKLKSNKTKSNAIRPEPGLEIQPQTKRVRSEINPIESMATLPIENIQQVEVQSQQAKEQLEIENVSLISQKQDTPVLTFGAAPLIADLIKKVESTLPTSMSQRQQNVFKQLKKAIENHTNILFEQHSDEKKEDKVEIQIEKKLPNDPMLGEIEIKIDQPQKQSKVQISQPNLEKQSLQKSSKLTLSQQFLLNLQRFQPIKDSSIQKNSDETSLGQIKLAIDNKKSLSKLKQKKETLVKFDKLDESIQSQPVTIAYYNPNNKAESTKNGSLQQSPPLQNPLEPKLAAGPASGYSNQQLNPVFLQTQSSLFNPQEISQFENHRPQPFANDQQMQNMITDQQMMEIDQRKQAKRERKRLRREEQRRLATENNVVQIDGQTNSLPVLQEIPNSSLITICTNTMHSDTTNLVQLSTNFGPQDTLKNKKKKSKKTKEKAVDIVIDSGMPSSMISIEQAYLPYAQIDPSNLQIQQKPYIPIEVSIQLPTYAQPIMFADSMHLPPNIQIPQFADQLVQPVDSFVITIPIKVKQEPIMLSLEQSTKLSKRQKKLLAQN